MTLLQNTLFTTICILALIYLVLIILSDYAKYKTSKKNKTIISISEDIDPTIVLKMLDDNNIVETVTELVDKLIKQAIDNYAILNAITTEVYLNKKDIDNITSYVETVVKHNMSDYVLYCIKMIVSIKTEKDLNNYISERVKFSVVAYVVNHNTPI